MKPSEIADLADLILAKLPATKRVGNIRTVLAVLRSMNAFGYLEGTTGNPSNLVERIKQFQRTLGIPEDGLAGEQTAKAAEMTPRCGCPDFGFARDRVNQWARAKATTGLTYAIKDYITGIPKDTQDGILRRAWESWEAVCGVKLIAGRRTDRADIVISCSASARDEFGSPGNVLAWAELPQGDTHARQLLMKFDLAEQWATGPGDRGILLENVACHEFGHLLGLDHTQMRGELMFPTYAAAVSKPQSRYDVPSVVERYGASALPPIAPVPVPVPVPDNVWSQFRFQVTHVPTGEVRVLA